MKRRLLTIAVFLLAGAVVNVAVAWSFAAFVPGVPRNGGKTEWLSINDPRARDLAVSGRSDVVGILELSCYGYDSLVVSGYRSINLGPDEVAVERDLGSGRRGWVRRLSYHGGSTTLFYHTARVGLPLRCFVGRRQYPSTHEIGGYVGACPVPRQVGPLKMNGLGFLPLRPIWPGFAVNTLFYAAILWLLIPGPFVLRRFLQLRRGLCPKCAYPMGESAVCTECGRLLPKRVVA